MPLMKHDRKAMFATTLIGLLLASGAMQAVPQALAQSNTSAGINSDLAIWLELNMGEQVVIEIQVLLMILANYQGPQCHPLLKWAIDNYGKEVMIDRNVASIVMRCLQAGDFDKPFDNDELVKVVLKKGETAFIMGIRNLDFGFAIHKFTMTLTNGEITAIRGPAGWKVERDGGSITFHGDDRPLEPGKGTLIRFRADVSTPIINWIAFDSEDDEIDSGTATIHRRPTISPISPTPIPVPPSRPPAIAVTPLDSEVITANGIAMVSGRNFAPGSNVSVMFEGRTWMETSTDRLGTFQQWRTVPNVPEGEYMVWAEDEKGNAARTVIKVHADDQRPPDPEQLIIWTENRRYAPGEVVIVYGNGTPNTVVGLMVANPNGETVFAERITADANGRFVLRFPLTDDAITGTYSIHAKQDNLETRTAFVVTDLAPTPAPTPLPIISVTTDKPRYQNNEVVGIYGRVSIGTADPVIGIAVAGPMDQLTASNNIVFKTEVKVTEDGLYRTSFQLDNARPGTYLVTAKIGSSEAHARFLVVGEPSLTPVPVISVATDKPRYQNDEVVGIHGRVSIASNADPVVGIAVAGPMDQLRTSDNVMFKTEVRVTQDGFYRTSFKLDNAIPGTYAVTAKLGSSEAHTRFLVVSNGSPPVELRCTDEPAEIKAAEVREGYIRVDGRNFTADVPVVLTIEGSDTRPTTLGRIMTNSHCSFENFIASVSDLPAGVYVVTAVDREGVTAQVRIALGTNA